MQFYGALQPSTPVGVQATKRTGGGEVLDTARSFYMHLYGCNGPNGCQPNSMSMAIIAHMGPMALLHRNDSYLAARQEGGPELEHLVQIQISVPNPNV